MLRTGFVEQRVREEVQRGQHEQSRRDGIERRSERRRDVSATAQNENRAHAERVERQDGGDERVGELLERLQQHESNSKRGVDEDGDVRRPEPRMHAR